MKSKNIQNPFVSVVMPVHNAQPFLKEAVDSILAQTYKNIEFVIVDDNSTDGSCELLQKMAKRDKRIRLLRNRKNLGVSQTVMKAIKKAKGRYLARMDADDISEPDRIKKQLSYLIHHPDTVAVGAQCHIINNHGKITGEKVFPTKHEDIYDYSFIFIPLQQPSMMINRSKLPKKFQYYSDSMNTAEEVELFFKLFKFGKVENINEYLLKYRMHDHNTTFKNVKQTFFLTIISRIKAVFVYDYNPSLLHVFVNLIQLFIILFLPEKLVIGIYMKIRKLSHQRSKKRSWYTLPVIRWNFAK